MPHDLMIMRVPCVPFAAPYDAVFSVPFGDNRRSDSVSQWPKRALCGR